MARIVRRLVGSIILIGVLIVSALPAPAQGDLMVVGWGRNGFGAASPPEIVNPLAISAGAAHSMALRSDGTVAVWGNNGYGQLDVPAGLSGVIAISAGGYHCLALKSDKTVVGWGGNEQYGQGEIPGGIDDAIGIAAGGFFSAVLHEGGTVTAWGRDDLDQIAVPGGLTNVKKIVAGWSHTLALKEDKTVVAWGYNGHGQCSVPGGLADVADIAAGNNYSFAIKEDGSIVCWGFNNQGQGSNPLGLTSPRSLDGGEYSSAAVRSDGWVVGWGLELTGISAVPSVYRQATAVGIGDEHGIAILESMYLEVTKQALKNVYPAGKADTCSFAGIIPGLSADFDPTSAEVTVYVGGASETFILSAKGSARVGKSSFAMKQKKGVWTVKAKLSGEYTNDWANEAGLLNRNEEYASTLAVQIAILANGRYIGCPRIWYKTVADKSGAGK